MYVFMPKLHRFSRIMCVVDLGVRSNGAESFFTGQRLC